MVRFFFLLVKLYFKQITESLYKSHEQLARDVEDKMDAAAIPTISVDPIKV